MAYSALSNCCYTEWSRTEQMQAFIKGNIRRQNMEGWKQDIVTEYFTVEQARDAVINIITETGMRSISRNSIEERTEGVPIFACFDYWRDEDVKHVQEPMNICSNPDLTILFAVNHGDGIRIDSHRAGMVFNREVSPVDSMLGMDVSLDRPFAWFLGEESREMIKDLITNSDAMGAL
jgi:hypothetical protein